MGNDGEVHVDNGFENKQYFFKVYYRPNKCRHVDFFFLHGRLILETYTEESG